MIIVEDLNKSFGVNTVLKGLDVKLNMGGVTAILGPNGSGKTTFIKCLLGLVLPDRGKITINGSVVSKGCEYKRDISYLPQLAHFPANLTVKELIEMIKDIRNAPTEEDFFISLFHLENELNKKMYTLSGGNKQKVNLLLALMYNSPLIILDEPSNGLDPLAIIKLKEYLLKVKNSNCQILITTHIMSFAEEVADHVLFLLEGKDYYNGTISDLLVKEESDNLETAIAHVLESHV